MTGHSEVVRVQFDPKECSYQTLLDVFWKRHDPTTLNRQVSSTFQRERDLLKLWARGELHLFDIVVVWLYAWDIGRWCRYSVQVGNILLLSGARESHPGVIGKPSKGTESTNRHWSSSCQEILPGRRVSSTVFGEGRKEWKRSISRQGLQWPHPLLRLNWLQT